MGNASIFAGSKVKTLKSTLNLNGGADVISSTVNPTVSATDALPGSLLLNTSSGKVYKKLDSGSTTNWQELTGGSSSVKEIVNYINNPDAETDTTGWATYADAAGTAPVDGTGGSPNITWSRSTTTPLRGVADFNLVKDAANRQGQGVSYSFTIDAADQAKILTISCDYEVVSGTYATGDLAVYVIQDPAGTPVVLQPAGYQVEAATIGNKVRLAATFQTASNVTSYRLCIHVASTSASAYTLALDSISVSPQQVVYGAPVTDWQSYTPTFNGSPSTASVAFRWRRVGDSIQIDGSFQITTVNASDAAISLPAGIAIDTTKVGTTRKYVFGEATKIINAASSALVKTVVGYNTTYLNQMVLSLQSGSQLLQQAGWDTVTANSDWLSIKAMIPVTGWSSSVVVSSSTDTRVVAARVYKTANQGPFSVETKLTGYTVDRDSHGMWDSVNNRFNIPVPGDYQIAIQTNGVPSVSCTQVCAYKVNGGATVYVGTDSAASGQSRFNGSTVIPNLKAGDYVEIYHFTSNSTTVQAGNSSSFATLNRLSGPSQIAASETVAARYTTATAQSIGSGTIVNFTTSVFDTHGAVTTGASWKFTAPIAGRYLISAAAFSAGTTFAQRFYYEVFKNGTTANIWVLDHEKETTTSTRHFAHGTAVIQLLAGDYIDLRGTASSGTTALSADAYQNYIEVIRVGN